MEQKKQMDQMTKEQRQEIKDQIIQSKNTDAISEKDRILDAVQDKTVGAGPKNSLGK